MGYVDGTSSQFDSMHRESRFLYDIIITAKGNPVCLTSHGALAEGKKERIHDASGTEKITLLFPRDVYGIVVLACGEPRKGVLYF